MGAACTRSRPGLDGLDPGRRELLGRHLRGRCTTRCSSGRRGARAPARTDGRAGWRRRPRRRPSGRAGRPACASARSPCPGTASRGHAGEAGEVREEGPVGHVLAEGHPVHLLERSDDASVGPQATTSLRNVFDDAGSVTPTSSVARSRRAPRATAWPPEASRPGVGRAPPRPRARRRGRRASRAMPRGGGELGPKTETGGTSSWLTPRSPSALDQRHAERADGSSPVGSSRTPTPRRRAARRGRRPARRRGPGPALPAAP